jgi:hypothetical protein
MMTIRKSDQFFTFIAGCLLVLLLFAAHAVFRINGAAGPGQRNLGVVSTLGLTDLCLFTEARYTRNPSQADRHAAFQDHPMALEHFPAGALLAPPPGVR